MKILVVGASGMMGSAIFRYLSQNPAFKVFGTIRNLSYKSFFSSSQAGQLCPHFEASDYQKWPKLFKKIKPNVVINCLGITKHVNGGNDPLIAIPINAYFPHYMNAICQNHGARLIHISSDCVFSGNRGEYLEADCPDAEDVYGRSKLLGEITQGPAITLRTSMIGHELHSAFGLLEWFLKQNGSCEGYKEVYFSGAPTLELARIIEKYIIPTPKLQGLYHVGVSKISKFDLLMQIAREYGKKIEIIPSSKFRVDRSLNSGRFYEDTGYKPPSWSQLIKEMHLSK